MVYRDLQLTVLFDCANVGQCAGSLFCVATRLVSVSRVECCLIPPSAMKVAAFISSQTETGEDESRINTGGDKFKQQKDFQNNY